MEGIANIAPPIITAVITALIGWLVIRRKESSEIRLIDTQTLNEWREFERDTSQQLLNLNNALIEYQLKMREMEDEMARMRTEYERRITIYKSQIMESACQRIPSTKFCGKHTVKRSKAIPLALGWAM